MIKIREMKLTPHEARGLKAQGFIVKFISVASYDKDNYGIFVLKGE